jgi:uncharacterized membrane protein
MKKKLFIYFHRLREQLWFRPLLFCLVSIAAALFAQQADGTKLDTLVPNIKTESIEGLLDTISSSMLVISIFCCWIDVIGIFFSKQYGYPEVFQDSSNR